jgi:hypothetical protein
LSRVAATFGEELGEAMAALYVLVTLRWHLPPATLHGGTAGLSRPRPDAATEVDVLRRTGSGTR